MKKPVRILIKGILLGLVFVLTFNLSVVNAPYRTNNTNISAGCQISVQTALAATDMTFTQQEVDAANKAAEQAKTQEVVAGIAAEMTPEKLAEISAAESKAAQEALAAKDAAATTEAAAAGTTAEAPLKTPSKSELMQKAINTVATIGNYTHMIFNPLINFLAFQTGNFLGNDYIYQGAMGGMLKTIWIVSRNIVNIIFVLILLGLALKEIFWLKEEGSNLKKQLIKFTLLLVAVNFSWMATKVVLDAANVATNIVFSIPMGVGSAAGSNLPDFKQCDVVNCAPDEKCAKKTVGLCYLSASYLPLDVSDASDYTYMKTEDCLGWGVAEEYDKAYKTDDKGNFMGDKSNSYYNKATYCWDTINFAKFNKNTTTIYLTYGMARIQNLVNTTSTENIVQLSVGILFSLFLQIAYSVALLALFIALIIRMAVLWLFVAFSPFLIVFIYIGGYKWSPEDSKISVDEFIRWAIVPVKVAAIFSVSFLMVTAGQAITETNKTFFDQIGGAATVSGKIFKFQSLFMGMDSIQQFIWFLVTLIVLWMGVFGILSKMAGVSMITNRIRDMGIGVGRTIATTPIWAPIMPMVDAEGKVKFKSMESQVVPMMQAIPKWRQAQIYGGDESNTIYKAAKELAMNDAKKSNLVTIKDPAELGRQIAEALGTSVKKAAGNREPIQAALKIAFADNPDFTKRAWDGIEAANKIGMGGLSAPVSKPEATGATSPAVTPATDATAKTKADAATKPAADKAAGAGTAPPAKPAGKQP